MSCKTLMVHLELDGKNAGLLKIAADLAGMLNARVIGIAACQPMQMVYDEGYACGDEIVADRVEITREIEAAKAEFHQALEGRVKHSEWRSCLTFGSLASYIADEARAADLILTRPDIGGSLLDNTRRVKIGDLALQAGRPIVIVPHGMSSLTLNNVFVAWKDSREARRAVADALPLLRLAKSVTVLEVAGEADQNRAHSHVADVAHWLETHDVSARLVTAVHQGPDAENLHAEMIARDCDFLVAGAYGHSRVGEFVFGGVTRDFLLNPQLHAVFLSH